MCRFLPCTRLSITGGIRLHTEGRVQIHHSQRRAYRHAGGVSTQDARFRLSPTKNCGLARLYFVTQYISLTILDLQYHARKFHIVQQQLRGYTTALPDVLSNVTSSLTSVTYVEPVPDTSNVIDYCNLFEELVTAV